MTYYLAPFVLFKFIFTDTLISMDDIDLELDEMELITAVADHYYYSCITKQPSHCLSPRRCQEMLWMDKHVFHSPSKIYIM